MSNPYYPLIYPILDLILNIKKNRVALDSNIRETFKSLFLSFDTDCRRLSLVTQEQESIKYALVALVDEVVCTIKSSLQSAWLSQPLQRICFGEHTAGEGFYERLNEARLNASQFVIEIYYLCLLIGFKGRYGLEDPINREQLIDSIKTQLNKLDTTLDLSELDPIFPVYLDRDTDYRSLKAWSGCILLGMLMIYVIYYLSMYLGID